LRIFLIGINDYKTIPLKELYSDKLIWSLHKDLRSKVESKLSIDIAAIELSAACGDVAQGEQNGDDDNLHDDDSVTGITRAPIGTNDDAASDYLAETEFERNDAEDGQEVDDEELDTDGDELENGGSGFGGRRPKFTAGKFWNFVDCSLENIRKIAKEETKDVEGTPEVRTKAYETTFRKYGSHLCFSCIDSLLCSMLVKCFQEDLADYHANVSIPKLLVTSNPQWQTIIQEKLIW